MNAWVLARKPGQIFWWTAAIDLVLIALIAVFWFSSDNNARFVFDVETEVLEVRVPPGVTPPSWTDIALSTDDAKGYCPGAKLRVAERVEKPMIVYLAPAPDGIQATLDGQGNSVGQVICPQLPAKQAPDYVSVILPHSALEPATLKLGGHMTLGAEPPARSRTTTLLRSGEIQVQAQSRPFPSGKVTDSTKLLMGDTVRFFSDAKAQKETTSYAVVRLKDGALHVVGQTSARQAHVQRVGQPESGPISIAPSAIARLKAQAEWAILALIGTLVLNLLGALTAYVSAQNGRKAG